MSSAAKRVVFRHFNDLQPVASFGLFGWPARRLLVLSVFVLGVCSLLLLWVLVAFEVTFGPERGQRGPWGFNMAHGALHKPRESH